MKNNNKLSITIGIPTYYGAPSIINTAKSILNSKTKEKFELVITVDGNPLKPQIKEELKKIGVKVWDNKNRLGQLGRIKELVKKTNSDLLILTQDDVIFSPYTVKAIIDVFTSQPQLTMAGCNVLPVKATNLFEQVIEVGVNLTHRIGNKWNQGDNYLLASGRCLAFRTKHAKKFNIDDNIINSDAYLYFLNKFQNGTFRFIEQAIVYNKSPHDISEHIKQSKKFQISQNEISKYLKAELNKEYVVPNNILFLAVCEEFVKNPIMFLSYLLVTVIARFSANNMYNNATRFWVTDVSTKNV